MFIDSRLEFADAVAVGAVNNNTLNVGNVIDTTYAFSARDIGVGQPLYLVINVAVAFTSAGATTISLLLSSDSTTALSVDDTQTTHWESDSVDEGQYTLGKKFIVPLPSGAVPTDVSGKGYERYLGVQVRNRTAQALTAGSIDAYLTFDPQGVSTHYADAVN